VKEGTLFFFQRSRDVMAKHWRNWFCVSVAPDSAKERVMGRTRSRPANSQKALSKLKTAENQVLFEIINSH
jgi:hypothetical protein